MDEIDYKNLYEQEQKKVSVLEQKLRTYELPGDLRAYYTLNRILNEQLDYLASFTIKTHIGSDPKEDKIYDRAKAIWESLRELTEDVNALKGTTGATGDEEKDMAARKSTFLDKVVTSR